MPIAARTGTPPARAAIARGSGPKLVDLRDAPVPAAHAAQALLGVIAGLLALYLIPVFLIGARLPFGSDAAYYVWMSRLAAHTGLAASGFRAGSHALLFGASSF